MKAICVHHAGGPEVLQIEELPRPRPRPGWVLIRVEAFGTRNPARASALQQSGAEQVVIDTGQIAAQVRDIVAGGVNGVLELVGATTLRDSLKAVAPHGTVCNSGILGNAWTLDLFEPLADIPSTVKLTVYTSDNIRRATASAALQHIVEGVEKNHDDPHIDRIFPFEQIVEAHRYMEENRATGKLVVRVDL